MLTAEQLEERYQGIGGSDAAAAVGLSPWKSPVQLWLEKTRRVQPEDLSDNEAVHFGSLLEDIVAQEYARRSGNRVQKWSQPYVHPEHTFMRCNVDRLVQKRDTILEAKTANAFTRWDDGPPDHYRLQCHHMMITAKKRQSVLAALIGGNSFEWWEIEWNDELADALIRKEAEFWQHVLDDVPPEPQTAADVVALYPVDDGNVVIATPELAEIHAELLAVRTEHKDLEARKTALEDKIKVFMGEHAAVVLTEDGKPIVSWKASRASERTDWKTAASEMASKLGDQGQSILMAHTRMVPGSRRFLPKELKA